MEEGRASTPLDPKPQVANGLGERDGPAESRDVLSSSTEERRNLKRRRFKATHFLFLAALTLFIILHFLGIYLFTSGFLLTRLVLHDKSDCSTPPIEISKSYEAGNVEKGCWHPRTFEKAVVIVVDALRYDFTVPFKPTADDPIPHHFHNALPFFYETAVAHPNNAFLLPFIADPPTTTLQRLKALTVGTLPTFVEAGSNFAGNAIEEDNLIAQLLSANKTLVQLGDDTWHSLFPGSFDVELSRPHDSFDVPDLHSVDNVVTTHLLPLLHPSNSSTWDVIIGHYLGVDHCGHRVGPDHPVMAAKLRQMDGVFRQVVELLDNKTLLIVMGDHGMDVKGDHGGESSDEVEAAIWMYSKQGSFGRTSPESKTPPSTAKERPITQIDLVPTLSLLLGMPIPFNNLGGPIEEAFIGAMGDDFENMAKVNRLTAAQIHKYRYSYSHVRELEEGVMSVPVMLWDAAFREWERRVPAGRVSLHQWESLSGAFHSYQQHTLGVYRGLWARFDLVSMFLGIVILVGSLFILGFYARGFETDDRNFQSSLFLRGSIGLAAGASLGFGISLMLPVLDNLRTMILGAGMSSALGCLSSLWSWRMTLVSPFPDSFLGWICLIIPLLLSAGFGANSFVIWEDEILLFFLAFFGAIFLIVSLRLRNLKSRRRALLHSFIFMAVIRIASISRLCREEQMPQCKATFYASATSSTLAPWQLAIPYLLSIILPTIIKQYYKQTTSYHGSAIFWIGFAFRLGLLLNAIYWTIQAADDAAWFNVDQLTLKLIRTYLAQFILTVNLAAGGATFIYAAPFIGIERYQMPTPAAVPPSKPQRNTKAANCSIDPKVKISGNNTAKTFPEIAPTKTQVLIRGTTNLYGSHYTLLPLSIILLPLLLLSKPMGQAALACLAIAILSLLELLVLLHITPSSNMVKSANNSLLPPSRIPGSPIGPTVLALLAHYAYFKSGHQATLQSIDWNAPFIALHKVSFVLSPIYIFLSTFSAHILCTVAVPCLVTWRRPLAPRRGLNTTLDTQEEANAPGALSQTEKLLHDLSRAYSTFTLPYALILIATTIEAAWLRRHLMLYRVFMPRWLLACGALIIVEVVGLVVGVGAGIGTTVGVVGSLFGW